MKFQVGDRVRLVENPFKVEVGNSAQIFWIEHPLSTPDGPAREGEVYTVTETWKDDSDKVESIKIGGKLWVNIHQFEKVEEE